MQHPWTGGCEPCRPPRRADQDRFDDRCPARLRASLWRDCLSRCTSEKCNAAGSWLPAAHRRVAPRSSREARRERDCICRQGLSDAQFAFPEYRGLFHPGRSRGRYGLAGIDLGLRPEVDRSIDGATRDARDRGHAATLFSVLAVPAARAACGLLSGATIPLSRVNAYRRPSLRRTCRSCSVWTERGDRWPVRTFLFYRNRERLFRRRLGVAYRLACRGSCGLPSSPQQGRLPGR